jgi:hypothetical protein
LGSELKVMLKFLDQLPLTLASGLKSKQIKGFSRISEKEFIPYCFS